MIPVFTIGITGGSGSGKTFFLSALSSYFNPDEVCLISQDNYYKPLDQQPRDKNGVENFDLPISIDRDMFFEDLKKIKSGITLQKKEYLFNQAHVQPKILEFRPAPVLIVEGLFVQYFNEVSDLLDLKVFIEAKTHLKVARRIRRDQIERGYDLNDVLYRFEHHVMPVYESLIEPLKHQADFIIPNNGKVDSAARVVAGYVRSLFKSNEIK